MHDLLDRSATELAAMVRRRDVSPVVLVDAHIARIERVNPLVNAVTTDRFAEARREARQAELRLGSSRVSDPLPPLFGVPCTIKEFIGVEGMPSTGGILGLRDRKADADGPTVARVRAAGAIILALSNVPEGGLWMETYNAIHGRTSNPWDLRRTCGGSSGGEGALVASGCSPFGLGSDVGGSVRIPAAFCGVAGHKPTGGLVPTTGHFPPASPAAARYLCVGPLARTVRDLELVMGVIAGPDPSDPGSRSDIVLGDADDVDLRDVTVIPMPTNGRMRVRDVMQAQVSRAAEALEARGATIKHVDIPEMRQAFEIWTAMLSEASDVHYATILGGGEPIKLGREIGRMLMGRSAHTFAGLALTLGDELTQHLPIDASRYLAAGAALQARIEQELGPNGVLLHPPYSRPAPRHRDSWRTATDAACTAIFNVLELPVTCVPTGFDPRGLPLAVQVAGSRGADHVTLAVARALEADLGGWVRANPGESPASA